MGPFALEENRRQNPPENPQQNSNQNLGAWQPKSTLQESAPENLVYLFCRFRRGAIVRDLDPSKGPATTSCRSLTAACMTPLLPLNEANCSQSFSVLADNFWQRLGTTTAYNFARIEAQKPTQHPEIPQTTKKTPRLHDFFRKVRANFCLLPCDTSQEPNGYCSDKFVQMNSFYFGWMFLIFLL